MGGGSEFPQKHSQWGSGVWENESKIHGQESYLRAVVDMGRYNSLAFLHSSWIAWTQPCFYHEPLE